jgi:hypothetical protein
MLSGILIALASIGVEIAGAEIGVDALAHLLPHNREESRGLNSASHQATDGDTTQNAPSFNQTSSPMVMPAQSCRP